MKINIFSLYLNLIFIGPLFADRGPSNFVEGLIAGVDRTCKEATTPSCVPIKVKLESGEIKSFNLNSFALFTHKSKEASYKDLAKGQKVKVGYGIGNFHDDKNRPVFHEILDSVEILD